MKRAPMIFLLFAIIAPLMAQTKVPIQHLDFQNEDAIETLISNIGQLESTGNTILIRTSEPYILEIDAAGNFLGTKGPAGFGSKTFQELTGMAAHGDLVIGCNPLNSFFLFHDSDLEHYFKGEDYHNWMTSPNFNSGGFGFNGEFIVATAHPKTGASGIVFNTEGKKIKTFGDQPTFDSQKLEYNPGYAAAFWAWEDGYWYALYKFKPLIRKYDDKFKQVAEFEFSGDAINRWMDLQENPKQAPQKEAFRTCFTDMKVFRGDVYAMCSNTLYRVNGKTGELLNTYQFFGNGEDFEELPAKYPLTLHHFTFMDDGTLVLSHPALLWNHDLWTADLKLNQKLAKK